MVATTVGIDETPTPDTYLAGDDYSYGGQTAIAEHVKVVNHTDGSNLLDGYNEPIFRVTGLKVADGDEVRFDGYGPSDTGDQYVGYAADGTATTATSWTVVRSYRTSSEMTRVRARTAVAWDSRTAGW